MAKAQFSIEVAEVAAIHQPSRGSKYPFKELAVGGYNEQNVWVGPSFFVPGDKAAATLRNSATRLSKEGYKFSIRVCVGVLRDGDGNPVMDEATGQPKTVTGARVWRVA